MRCVRWILPLAITSVALLSSPALASWVRVLTNAENDMYSVDVDSIEGRGRYRYFWSHINFGQPITVEEGQRVHSVMFYLSVDCQSKLYRLRYLRLLDANDRPMGDANFGEDLGLAGPGFDDGAEASLKLACSRR